MTLAAILTAVANRQKTLHHYGSTASDLAIQFAGRNVTVESHQLPPDGPDPFVVIKDGETFLGAISEADLQSFLSPSTTPRWRIDEAGEKYHALYTLLDDTVFASLDRRQLLGAAREIEDRAHRVGHGRLSVGFQTHAAFEAQRALYERLATDTDLDIHVYVVDECPADLDGITVHVEPTPEIGRYWFMAFDGGDDPSQQCALVAQQHGDSYEGVWTYEPRLVERVFAALDG